MRDGSSPANAGALGDLDSFIAKAGQGGEVLLLADQGAYKVTREIPITHGGVTIRGVDSLGNPMAAEIVGTRSANWAPGLSDGRELFRLLSGANDLTFQDLDIKNVGNGAFRIGADLDNLTIRNVDASNVMRFVENYRSGTNTSASVDGLTIQDVNVTGYSRGTIRLQYNTRNVLIENVVGDSQAQDGGKYIFGVILDDTVHDVILRNVEMKNNQGNGSGYWNGDGFTTERGVYNVLFENTRASGNSDGGYDLKSSNTVLINAQADGNNKNYRFWSDSITLIDSVSLNPTHSGGTGAMAHVWLATGATATIQNLTFSDAGTPRVLFDMSNGGGKINLSGTLIPSAYENLLNLGSFSTVEIVAPIENPDDLASGTVNLVRTTGNGDDVLAGGDGNDTLRGRSGNDTYLVNSTGDKVIERSRDGVDLVQATIAEYRLADHVENLVFAGTGDFVGNGNSSNNVITAGSGNDLLQGGEGHDTLVGGDGLDTLSGGNGNDAVYGGAEADGIRGGGGSDRLSGDAGDDVLSGEDGWDVLEGGDGHDWLDGGRRSDRMVGGLGNDTYVVNDARDLVIELAGEGTDLVFSNVTHKLSTGVEHLTLTGSKAVNGTGNELDNALTGNANKNALWGGAGDDTLNGGAGNDTLVGQDGADTYLFGRGSGRDAIANADGDGGVDRLVLGAGITADQLWFSRSGFDLVVGILGTKDAATIKGWYSSPANQVEVLELSNGDTLAAANVQQLVGAMAAFRTRPASISSLTQQQQQTVETAIANAWQPAE